MGFQGRVVTIHSQKCALRPCEVPLWQSEGRTIAQQAQTLESSGYKSVKSISLHRLSCCASIPASAATNAQCNADRRHVLHVAAACALATLANSSLAVGTSAASLVDEDVATAVFHAAKPSVASIAVVRTVGGVPVREVVGSGIVWDAAGPHVVTNFHILPPLQGTSSRLQVTVTGASTGATITTGAQVAGTDSLHDLAVLRLLPLQQPQPGGGAASGRAAPWGAASPDAATAGGYGGVSVESEGASAGGGGKAGREGGGETVAATVAAIEELDGTAGLPAVAPIRVGTSADLRVGQAVFALGCLASDSGTAAHTLSAGLVSGLGRSIPSPVGARIYGVIQTDALVNAANSGGPLLDSFGRLVGLNTAVGSVRSNMGRGSGVNFALPADLLRDLVPKIIVYGNAYGKK